MRGIGSLGRGRLFDARVVGIAVGADDVCGFVDAEKTGKAEVRAAVQVFVAQAGLEAGHDRSAGLHVVDLPALAVTQHGDVGQQEGAIPAETFRFEPVFMHKVECEAPTQQGQRFRKPPSDR
jgi:hypothetical protein